MFVLIFFKLLLVLHERDLSLQYVSTDTSAVTYLFVKIFFYIFLFIKSQGLFPLSCHPLMHINIQKKENKSVSRGEMYIEKEKIDF